MFRFASAARAGARAGARRTYATAPGTPPVVKKSDLPWLVASLAVTVPTIFYLTSPKEDSHTNAHGHHGTKSHIPAPTVEEASASAHADPEQVKGSKPSASGTAEVESEKEAAADAEKEEETSEEAEAKEKADVPAGTVKTSEKGKLDGAALPAEDVKKDPTPGPKNVAEAGKASQQAHQAAKAEEKEEQTDDEEKKDE